jgi:hypothetical protein
MKYIKKFESKKHKYKIGDWVIINVEDDDFIETGEILALDNIVGRDKDEDLGYTINTYNKIPEELSYMQYGDDNSTMCIVEEKEIERRLNKKEAEQAKLEKIARKYNL